MTFSRQTSNIGYLACVSGIALGVALFATPVQARCTGDATVLNCDTVSPNPDSVGAAVTVRTVNVAAGATLTSTLSATLSPAGTPVVITNAGTIQTTHASGRAINIAGANDSRTITITNNAGGLITSADDAVRVNFNPTGGTITVTNAGTISTTTAGQAIDFDAAASGSATIVINNLATGALRSVGQDAIRPGQGATVTNAGLIFSDGPANNSFDGIDWQGKSGTVNNQATGTISGLRHGITSDVNVNVTNAGTILGRNGSGIGSDGVGSVTNTGTITGRWDGVATNGDGDGVDIDLIGTVVNSGTIQGLTATGVDSGGRPNSAQGVAMGGGSITNNAGATIFGGAQGVLINLDTNPGGVAVGATTILNAGTIQGGTAHAIQLVGDFADSVTSSGAIIGGGGVALDLGGGNDSLTLTGAASFTGTLNGGAGADTITLGTTTGNTLQGTNSFETLAVNGTNWRLGPNATFASGIGIAASGGLTGTSATLTGVIANAGTLTVDQATDGTFAATLSGTGTLVKTGTGALTIGNVAGFTGPTSVAQGRLVLAGILPGAVTVQNGGTLAGNGSVGATTIASGGTIAPGNSIGTIIVNGNFTAQAGSTYVAETAGTAGTTDLIAVNGAASLAAGARLQVVRDATPYTVGYRYTVLTATGGVTGTYTLLQDANPLTEFRLGGTAGSVFVDVARTAAGMAGVAGTPNQVATAAGLGSAGVANAAYAALTLIPADGEVRAGLDGLSGEVHSTLFTSLLADVATAQSATRGRLLDDGSPAGIWATGLRRWASAGGNGNVGLARDRSWGVMGGVDAALGGLARVGIAGGVSWTDLALGSRASSAEWTTAHVLAYAGGAWGAVRLNLTAGYAWSDVTTRRRVAFIGFADSLGASYKATTLHGGADIGYRLGLGAGSVEPFAGVEVYSVTRDAFSETGGAAALAGTERRETHAISTLGARFSTPIVDGLSARGQLGWRHAFGELAPTSALRFAGGAPFSITGAPLSEDAAALELALRYSPSTNVALTGGYSGTIGGAGDESRFQIGLSIAY